MFDLENNYDEGWLSTTKNVRVSRKKKKRPQLKNDLGNFSHGSSGGPRAVTEPVTVPPPVVKMEVEPDRDISIGTSKTGGPVSRKRKSRGPVTKKRSPVIENPPNIHYMRENKLASLPHEVVLPAQLAEKIRKEKRAAKVNKNRFQRFEDNVMEDANKVVGWAEQGLSKAMESVKSFQTKAHIRLEEEIGAGALLAFGGPVAFAGLEAGLGVAAAETAAESFAIQEGTALRTALAANNNFYEMGITRF
ncbi:MAG: hypothetical protein QKV64_gp2 [Avonheates virus SG_154]|uniref:hypothetical protein n=1 Tax=Avonheates virus SG_154 TaxID=2914482 RepID=UPI0024819DB3|nr:MAG: hypothetical protein QKV64_gp2 [Avonheates virus SG_154]UNI72633.1 MAG: hypothetical protein [Avonheates virus SG_154]